MSFKNGYLCTRKIKNQPFKLKMIMKALRVMAVVMMASFVGVCLVACGGQKAEAPAAAEVPAAVEAAAPACACDSCACDSCACAACPADSCAADSSCCKKACEKACCDSVAA